MTAKELIEKLQTVNPNASIKAPDVAVGGSVDVLDIEVVNDSWVDLILADE